jgi:hypothetical protein
MKTFDKIAAQGEITITRIDKLPADLIEITPVDGKFIIGHSETGHHHVMMAEKTRVFAPKKAPAGMRVLYAILDEPNVLEHQRPFDTHESIQHAPGVYKFTAGREFDHYAQLSRAQAD